MLRPGRLEMHIEIGLPGPEDRAEIVQLHASKLPAGATATLVADSAGATVAEIEHLFHEAAVLREMEMLASTSGIS